jgi:hypothetical protein
VGLIKAQVEMAVHLLIKAGCEMGAIYPGSIAAFDVKSEMLALFAAITTDVIRDVENNVKHAKESIETKQQARQGSQGSQG